MGADYETYCLISEQIARSCGATALTFNMHASTMLWIGQLADDLDMSSSDRQAHDARRRRVFRGVLDDGHIYAQPLVRALRVARGDCSSTVGPDVWRADFASQERRFSPRWQMRRTISAC